MLANLRAQIEREIELGELDTGRGANQLGSLQRAGDTRWSSHYKSIQSLKKMFAASVSVLRSIPSDCSVSQFSRGDAVGALRILISFDFVFILHLMEKITRITDVLCVRLQTKSLDILNALDCVSNTKVLLADLRENGWESLLEEVNSFCLKHEIDIPDFNHKYAPFLNYVLKIMLHIYYLVKLILMYIIIRYVDVTKSRNKHETPQHSITTKWMYLMLP